MDEREKSNKSSGSSEKSHSGNRLKLKGSDWWPSEAPKRPQTGAIEVPPGDRLIPLEGAPVSTVPLSEDILARSLPLLKAHVQRAGVQVTDLEPGSVMRELLDLVAIMLEQALLMQWERAQAREKAVTEMALEAGKRLREEYNKP